MINANTLKKIKEPNQQQVIDKIKTLLDDQGYIKKNALLLWIHQLLDFEFSRLIKVSNGGKPKYELKFENSLQTSYIVRKLMI